MRRVLLLLLASGAIASSNFVPDPGGQPSNRFNTLFTLAQNRQHYRSLSSTDSATQAARSWPGEMWLHERNRMYFVNWKANDGTILSGNPQWWNLGYQWRTDSYGAFVTGATNSTLTRSGSGTTASPYTLGLNLGTANSWTARQTFKSTLSDSVMFKATGDAGITTIKARTDLTAGESYTLFLPLTSGTSGAFLTAFGNGLTGWGAAVTNVTAGGGLKRTTSGSTYTLGIDFTSGNDWTGVQSFVGFDLKQAAGSDEVQFRSPVLGASWTFTMPPDNGDANEFLQTDGNGTATWEPEADGVIGNEVTGASADSILKRTGAGTTVAPYTLRFDTTRALTLTNNFEVRDTVKFGDGTNYTMTESDGTMHMVGNATVWDDLRITPGMIEKKGPSYVNVTTGAGAIGTWLLEFEKNDSATFIVQLPHGYKEGSNIYARIHWTAGENADTFEGRSVGWKIAYSWANIGQAFPPMTEISLADTVSGDDWVHQMTTDTQINGAGKTVSSILACNIKRSDTGDDDTWTDGGGGTASGQLPLLLEIDFHYEMDTIGSRTQSAK